MAHKIQNLSFDLRLLTPQETHQHRHCKHAQPRDDDADGKEHRLQQTNTHVVCPCKHTTPLDGLAHRPIFNHVRAHRVRADWS